MTKIAISPNVNGTGTFTIAAPNSNTDRTLTLPDAAGTVNTSGQANEVPAGSAAAPSVFPTGNTNTGLFFPGADVAAFATGGAERMRLDGTGNVMVGTTSSQIGTPGGETGFACSPSGLLRLSRDGEPCGLFDRKTSNGALVLFRRDGSTVGSISVTTTSTAYSTSSDHRLKEDVQPMVGASDRVLALKPVNFAWKVDGTRVDGFLAHEAQAVVPEAVHGLKDEVDADGNPMYQGIDQSKLVPLLTAALQEALADIATLKAEVAALKGASA